MKQKEVPQILTCEPPILDLEDLLRDRALRVIGLVGDKNQGKSGVLYNICNILRQHAPDTKLVGFRMQIQFPGMLMLNDMTELSLVKNSVVCLDEVKTFVDTDNRTEFNDFMTILQTLYHPYRNNTIIISGLAHNFNGKLSGELDAIIFKQTTMISIIKRSVLDNVLKGFKNEGKATKDKYMLGMPEDTALVYHPRMQKHWHCISVPYLAEYDVKKDNQPVIKWKD